MPKLIARILVVLALGWTGAANAATLVVLGGQLRGADDVSINGRLYDVRFLKGNCADLFGGCDTPNDFQFSNETDARSASSALLNQVFRGNYDDNPDRTYGCSNSYYSGCSAITPYLAEEASESFTGATAKNMRLGYTDSIGGVNWSRDQPTSTSTFFAKFSPSTPDTVIVDGREWAQVDLFINLSWNDINAVCPTPEGVCVDGGTLNGYDVTGMKWASVADVNALFNTYLADAGVTGEDLLDPTNPDSYAAPNNNSAWASAIFTQFRATKVGPMVKYIIGNAVSVNASSDAPYQPAILDYLPPDPVGDYVNTEHEGGYAEVGGPGAWFYRMDSDNDMICDANEGITGVCIAGPALGDNCRTTPNNNQSDTDVGGGDGIGDVCDNCPSISNQYQGDHDDDGIGNPCDPDWVPCSGCGCPA